MNSNTVGCTTEAGDGFCHLNDIPMIEHLPIQTRGERRMSAMPVGSYTKSSPCLILEQ
jgi:hypothetical protein